MIYMGDVDMERQELNVLRMRLLGAEVRGVSSGSKTLKDAISEAMRDWVTNVRTTHYLLGSALGAHPYPTMVRDFHRCISREMKEQILEKEGRLPTAVHSVCGRRIECDWRLLRIHSRPPGTAHRRGGGRSRNQNWENMRHGSVVECQACCRERIPTCCRMRTDKSQRTHSVSAGLDYASIGPEHAALHDSGRAEYVSQDDVATLDAVVRLSRTEGILPALESAHAVAECLRIAPMFSAHDILVVNLSGRGDKDMGILARELNLQGA